MQHSTTPLVSFKYTWLHEEEEKKNENETSLVFIQALNVVVFSLAQD